MNAVELRDKLLHILFDLKVPREKFLKGELSFEATDALQKELGPWDKVIDYYDRKKTGPEGVWVKVFYFKHHKVYLGAEAWYDAYDGPLWDTSWIHEYSQEKVVEFLANQAD